MLLIAAVGVDMFFCLLNVLLSAKIEGKGSREEGNLC